MPENLKLLKRYYAVALWCSMIQTTLPELKVEHFIIVHID